MKKRNTANLTLVVLLLVILSLIGVSGTYAKYTTTVNGTGTAIVAKWNFQAKDGNNVISEGFVVDLAEHATTGVVTVGDTKKIQPGSKGEITITIDNTGSEVAATLDVKAESNAGDTFTKSQFEFKDVTLTDANGTTITEVPAGGTATAKVPFEWKYNVSANADTEDTTIGKGATEEAITLVTIKVTGTQVAPQ